MSWGDWLLLSLVGLWLVFAVRSVCKNKGSCGCCGGSGCCGDCAHCRGCKKK